MVGATLPLWIPAFAGMTNSVAGTIHPGAESGTCFRTNRRQVPLRPAVLAVWLALMLALGVLFGCVAVQPPAGRTASPTATSAAATNPPATITPSPTTLVLPTLTATPSPTGTPTAVPTDTVLPTRTRTATATHNLHGHRDEDRHCSDADRDPHHDSDRHGDADSHSLRYSDHNAQRDARRYSNSYRAPVADTRLQRNPHASR